MDVVIWTLVFLGGTLVILLSLMAFAAKKDREKARTGVHSDSEEG